MPSPFPGMDPYLETPALWSDLHASFITYWRDALLACLPSNYEARIEKVHPDVAVTIQRLQLIQPVDHDDVGRSRASEVDLNEEVRTAREEGRVLNAGKVLQRVVDIPADVDAHARDYHFRDSEPVTSMAANREGVAVGRTASATSSGGTDEAG